MFYKNLKTSGDSVPFNVSIRQTLNMLLSPMPCLALLVLEILSLIQGHVIIQIDILLSKQINNII